MTAENPTLCVAIGTGRYVEMMNSHNRKKLSLS